MAAGPLLHTSDRQADAAFSLVELLVASVIAGIVLSASLGWVWSVAVLARADDDRAQAATLAAAASRAVIADVRAAVGVGQPPAGRDPVLSLFLVHDHPGAAAEEVLIVWDPARRVLWRNASGTYLADHVSHFAVCYDLGGGQRVDAASMSGADWQAVRTVQVQVTTVVGSATESRTLEIAVGPA
jgi:prepilin-type N-terminal cleavage/methylation domain-containing protein